MEVTPDQIKQAAATGLELLADREIRISAPVALSGSLQLLHLLLTQLATGRLVLTQKEEVSPPGNVTKLSPNMGG